MRLTARIPVTAGMLTLLLLSATGCKRLESNNELNKGVAAFKNTKYEDATDHFQRAVTIDPDNMNARIFLGTSYSSQVIPNLTTPDNMKLAKSAMDTFQGVLDRDPNNVLALKQIASIQRNTGHPDAAKEYQKKVIALAPNEAEPS